VPIWSVSPNPAASAGDTLTYSLSPDLAAGSVVELQARAFDSVGNLGNAMAQVLVAQGASGPGYLQGEAYHDGRGLLLDGVEVTVTDDTGTTLTALTPADGGYFLELPSGDYLVRLARDGFTPVERTVTVRPEINTQALDARLTPVSYLPQFFDVLGGSAQIPLGNGASASVVELTVPVDALTEEFDFRLTPVSNQGLIGLLPPGWSPLAVLDLRALNPFTGEPVVGGVPFATPATVKVPVAPESTLAPGAEVALAVYDPDNHQWLALPSGVVGPLGQGIVAPLPATGQYALLLADPAPNAPAPALAGQPLPPAASAALAYEGVATAGRVVPAAAPPSAGLLAAGEVVVTGPGDPSAAPVLTSGLVLSGRVTERFDLFSGETVQPAEYIQDLILYRAPCVTNIASGVAGSAAAAECLRTTFPISPSRDYTIVDLLMGKVGIEINPGGTGAGSGIMVGPDGARLIDSDGNLLVIPAGALGQTVPVSTRTLPAELAEAVVGSDFTLLRGVEVDLTRQRLQSPAALSIPTPAAFNPALPVIVARAIEVRGVRKLKLVALAASSGSVITTDLGGNLPLAGVVTSGSYYFLQAKAPLGFVQGTVSDALGNSFASALVSSSTGSLVDLTGTDGRYLLAASLGTLTASALDIYKDDQASAAAELTVASQLLTVDLRIQATPPQIVSIEPGNGSTGVEPNVPVVITFSEPVDRSTVTAANIVLTDDAGVTVGGAFSVNPEGTVVSLYPAADLASETLHTLSISSNIRDLQGYPLGQTLTASFTVRDTTPPPPPPAGSITSSFPDDTGFITVTATQGSAEIGSTVLLINDTSGEISTVTPSADGSFVGRVRAQLGDEIQVVLMDEAGNQTLISYLTFKSADGRYLVTSKGGKVEGEGGVVLEIPQGALVGPAVVKITSFKEADLAYPIPEGDLFLAGLNIDTGGVNFQEEVDISIPVPADYPEKATPMLVKPVVHVNPDGTEEELFEIIDSMKIIDGRITTASPPFYGAHYPGPFMVVVMPIIQVAIISGTTYKEVDGSPGYTAGSDLPIPGAVIRCPQSWNYISYSGSNGFYATYGTAHNLEGIASSFSNDFSLTAINPQTMYRITANLPLTAPFIVRNLNFRLADKQTAPQDTSAPIISLSVQAAPGQEPQGRIVAGTVPRGTELLVEVSVIDQDLKSANLAVEFRTPEMTGPQVIPAQLTSSGKDLHTPMTGESPPVYRYNYQVVFDSTLAGSETDRFRTDALGTYTVVLTAEDNAGKSSTKKIQVRTVEVGNVPDSIDGAPQVDEILPGDGAREIMVTMPVIATFSEPVANLDETTFYLLDRGTGAPVPAFLYTSIEGGQMRATLQPKRNLKYDGEYEIVLTRGIIDQKANESFGNVQLPLDREYRTTFKTKVPQAYDLTGDQFKSGWDIDLFTDAKGKTYAYVSAREYGWRVIDVTDPTKPVVVYAEDHSTGTISWSCRGLAVDQQAGVMAVTEDIAYAFAQMRSGMIRFYDLNEDPAHPTVIGRERLAENFSGIPGRVALSGGYAYVCTAGVGLQVVSVAAAIDNFSKLSDGSSIVGFYDSIGEGYGQPISIFIYPGGRAVLTTTMRYLLVLDLSNPTIPTLMSAFRPDGYSALRATVAADFPFVDAEGNSRVMDLAVTGGNTGAINTVDLSDPYNPQVIGVGKDADGQQVFSAPYDITISPNAGLVFVTTFSSIQVFDVKDPYNPLLLLSVANLPDENGNMMPIGQTPGIVEKDGWVYLANMVDGMRALTLNSVFLYGGLAPLADTAIIADEGQTPILLYLKDIPEEFQGKPVTIYWEVNGPGGYLTNNRTTSSDGIFWTTLRTSRKAGDSYKVTPYWAKSDGTLQGLGVVTGNLTVVPGEAETLKLTSTRDSYAADGKSTIEVEVTAKDAYGNFVADGTDVSWGLEGDGELINGESETLNGRATAIVRAGDAAGTQTIFTHIDKIISSKKLELVPLDITVITGKSQVAVGGDFTTIEVQVVGDVSDGAQVVFFSTLGKIENNTVINDGKAIATFHSRDISGNARITANIGQSYGFADVEIIDNNEYNLSVEPRFIIGDRIESGTESIDIGSEIIPISYSTTSNIKVKGRPGSTLQLKLRENIEPIAWYMMDAISSDDTVSDIYHDYDATYQGITVDSESYVSGSSYLFNGQSQVEISHNEALPDDHISFNVNIKPRILTANKVPVIVKDGTYQLSLMPEVGGYRAQLTIQTDQGERIVTSNSLLLVDQWFEISFSINQNTLQVSVDGSNVTEPYNGQILHTENKIVVGKEFIGNLDNLKIFDLDRLGLLTLQSNNSQMVIVLDVNGEATVAIQSLGALRLNCPQYGNVIVEVGELKEDGSVEEHASIFIPVISIQHLAHFLIFRKNFNDSVLLKEGAWGPGAVVGDIVAGVLVYGDIAEINKLHPKMMASTATVMEKITYFLAWTGVVTSVNPVVDTAAASVKSLAKSGKLVLSEKLAKQVLGFSDELAIAFEKGSWDALADLTDEGGELLQKMASNDEMFEVVEGVATATRKGVDEVDGDLLKAIYKHENVYGATSVNITTLKTKLSNIGGIDVDKVLKNILIAVDEISIKLTKRNIKLSPDAVEGIAQIMVHTGDVKTGLLERLFLGAPKKAQNVVDVILKEGTDDVLNGRIIENVFKNVNELGGRNIPGFGEFIRDFTRGDNAVKGGYHTLEYLSQKVGFNKIERFEVRTGLGGRRVDVQAGGRWYEFKNVESTSLDKHTQDQFFDALLVLKEAGETTPDKLVMVFRNDITLGAEARLNEITKAVFGTDVVIRKENLIRLNQVKSFYTLD
jgi:hypothetical protein